jgi:hypothetical protein
MINLKLSGYEETKYKMIILKNKYIKYGYGGLANCYFCFRPGMDHQQTKEISS